MEYEIPFMDDKANGLGKYYYKSGKKKMEITYKNGESVAKKEFDKWGDEIINANLMTMLKEMKENEYAFNQKYINRTLRFSAKVDRVESICAQKVVFGGESVAIPCAKLNPVNGSGRATPIASAKMEDKKDLLSLQKGQQINLQCLLTEKSVMGALFSDSSYMNEAFIFGDCVLMK